MNNWQATLTALLGINAREQHRGAQVTIRTAAGELIEPARALGRHFYIDPEDPGDHVWLRPLSPGPATSFDLTTNKPRCLRFIAVNAAATSIEFTSAAGELVTIEAAGPEIAGRISDWDRFLLTGLSAQDEITLERCHPYDSWQ